MRLKLIALFTLVVLVVGGLGYALSRVAAAPLAAEDPKRAPQALEGAIMQLRMEGLATERWVTKQAANKDMAKPLLLSEKVARQRSAKETVDRVYADATDSAKAPELSNFKQSITTVMLIDRTGEVLGRNRSADIGGNRFDEYPAFKKAIEEDRSASEIWVSRNPKYDEQLLASYAPIHDAENKVVGALVVASGLDDSRLSASSERTSGQALVVLMKVDKPVIARSESPVGELFNSGAPLEGALKTIESNEPTKIGGLPDGYTGYARPIEGYEGGTRATIVAVVKPPPKSIGAALVWPAVVATILGILLVVIAGYMIDVYLRRPISEIEDGLLAIMNGQTNRRLDIDHAELGGVVFRINSLLNQLFGVTEDDTDEEGRPSRAPTGQRFTEALSVDESVALSGGGGDAASLFAEAEDAYYARTFGDYIRAKRSIGDPTDHITVTDFTARLKSSEAELAQKHGKPVRFRVELKGKEVVLVAVSQG